MPRPSNTTTALRKINLQLPDFQNKIPLDPEEVKSILVAYFNKCVEENKIPTFTGMAKILGMTRQELLANYHSDPVFSQILIKAKQTIIEFVEQLLLSGRPPIGLIFWLKNNDNWIDKTEVAHTNKSMSEILDELSKQGEIITQPQTTPSQIPSSSASLLSTP